MTFEGRCQSKAFYNFIISYKANKHLPKKSSAFRLSTYAIRLLILVQFLDDCMRYRRGLLVWNIIICPHNKLLHMSGKRKLPFSSSGLFTCNSPVWSYADTTCFLELSCPVKGFFGKKNPFTSWSLQTFLDPQELACKKAIQETSGLTVPLLLALVVYCENA